MKIYFNKWQSRKFQAYVATVIISILSGFGWNVDPELIIAIIGLATLFYQWIEYKLDSADIKRRTNVVDVNKLLNTIIELQDIIEEMRIQLSGEDVKSK